MPRVLPNIAQGWRRVTVPSVDRADGDEIEATFHGIPRRIRDEVSSVFPGVDVSDMVVLITCQRARVDPLGRGREVDAEKDRLLHRFFHLAKFVTGQLQSRGYWADWVDPSSGLPMVHRSCAGVYDEVAGLAALGGFRVQNAGCCKIALHPAWGSAVYPASVFAKAPLAEVEEAWARALASLTPKRTPICTCCGGSVHRQALLAAPEAATTAW